MAAPGTPAANARNKMRSTEAASRLEIPWEIKRLPRNEKEGYGRSIAPIGQMFDRSFMPAEKRPVRPAVVWFRTQEETDKIDKRLWDMEEVAVAARLFDCAKVYVEDIETEAERDLYAKKTPTVVFLDSRGKEVTRLVGESVTANQVYEAMKKTAAVDFKTSLEVFVSRYKDFLKRFDKAMAKVSNLEEEIKGHDEHLARHDCEPARRQKGEALEDMKKATVERDKVKAEEPEAMRVEVKPERSFAPPKPKEPAPPK